MIKRIFSTIISLFVFIIFFVLFCILVDKRIELFLPDDYLFYEHSPVASNLLAPILVFPPLTVAYMVMYFLNKKEYDPLNLVALLKILGNRIVIPVLLWCFCLYFCIVNVNCVTEDKIITKSTFNPVGKEYEYSDIEKIETGFGKKKKSIFSHEEKGNFYYFVFIDGEKIIFNQTSPNDEIERYNKDSYLELEEFDNALKKYNIPKESDAEGWENCDYDQRYVDRFLRIINSN